LSKNIFSIGLIVLGLIIGQIIRKLVIREIIPEKVPVSKYLIYAQKTIIFGINPVITLGAFWGARLNEIRYVFLPILGICALSIGGLLGFTASKILKHERRQTGSMFCSASFTNLGSFGALICFVFFGEKSYVFVSLYRLFEELTYFLIGFPVAKLHGNDTNEREGKNSLIRIVTDPYIIVYIASITIGMLLNISGFARPAVYTGINEIFIPISSILLVISVGFSMRITAIGGYLRECMAVSAVKFLILPIIITSLAYLAGLGSINGGLALKVVLVLSAMPPAFYSLIPPQLYGLDTDLANSCWLFGSGSLALVIPILFMVQGLM